MKLNNNDDSHNSGLNLLIYNMLLDIESHPAWVCGLKLAKDRENGEKALEKLSPKRSVMTDLRVNPTGESPWNKRMSEIKDKLNHK